jgi:hypothetical protein
MKFHHKGILLNMEDFDFRETKKVHTIGVKIAVARKKITTYARISHIFPILLLSLICGLSFSEPLVHVN